MFDSNFNLYYFSFICFFAFFFNFSFILNLILLGQLIHKGLLMVHLRHFHIITRIFDAQLVKKLHFQVSNLYELHYKHYAYNRDLTKAISLFFLLSELGYLFNHIFLLRTTYFFLKLLVPLQNVFHKLPNGKINQTSTNCEYVLW